MPSIVGRCCPLGGHFAALCQNVWFIRRFADSEHGLDEVEKRILASWAGCSSPNTRAFIHHQQTCVRSISFRFWLVSFHQMGKREQKLRLAMGRKEEVETQEKIWGRVCFFCSLLFIIPLKIYASRGENYSTNDTKSPEGWRAPDTATLSSEEYFI